MGLFKFDIDFSQSKAYIEYNRDNNDKHGVLLVIPTNIEYIITYGQVIAFD